jgi:hypothetical protein
MKDDVACWSRGSRCRRSERHRSRDRDTLRGTEEVSTIGDMVGMARNCGVAAIVTDGLVRDLPGIERTGIPVFGRGVSPNSPIKDGNGVFEILQAAERIAIRRGVWRSTIYANCREIEKLSEMN